MGNTSESAGRRIAQCHVDGQRVDVYESDRPDGTISIVGGGRA